MAFWGAPIYDPNHANYACKTALLLVQKLQKVNKKLKKMGLPEIRVGAGLNTGYMVVGNIGSNQRFDYTVMGDAVNLGSRLEGLTKQYGVSVIVSEFTYRYVKNDFVFRKLDFVRVKGKNEPITIYELVGFKNEVSSSRINKIKEFEKALNLYKEGMFDKAKALFIKIGDNPSKVFLNRCDELIASKPKDWQGIYTMKTK
jgi:adenylate cyclase